MKLNNIQSKQRYRNVSMATKKQPYFQSKQSLDSNLFSHNSSVSRNLSLDYGRQSKRRALESPTPRNLPQQSTHFPKVDFITIEEYKNGRKQIFSQKNKELHHSKYSLQKDRHPKFNQDFNSTRDNIEISITTTVQKRKMPDSNQFERTEQKLTELKQYFEKERLRSTFEQSQTLRNRNLDNSSSRLGQNNFTSLKSNAQRKKEQVKIESEPRTNKDFEYNKIITKTLEETIDENIRLKVQMEQVKDKYRDAIKAIKILQAVIEQKFIKAPSNNKKKEQKLEFKQIYKRLNPYDNVNRVIKPNIQTQVDNLILEEEQKMRNIGENLRLLQYQMVQAELKAQKERKLSLQLKKQNQSKKEEIERLKVAFQKLEGKLREKETFIIKQQKQRGSEMKKEIETAFNVKIQSIQNQSLGNDFPTASKCSVSKISVDQATQSGFQIKQQAQKVNKEYMQSFLMLIFEEIQKQQHIIQTSFYQKLQITLNKLQKVQQSALQIGQVPEYKKGQRRKEKHLDLIPNRQEKQSFIQESQVFQENNLSNTKIMQKNGLQPGETNKNNHSQISSNSGYQNIGREPFSKIQSSAVGSRRPTTNQEQLKLRIKQLQIKIRVNQQIYLTKIEDYMKNYKLKLQALNEGLIFIKSSIQNCNIKNFSNLFKEFYGILSEKKAMATKIKQLESRQNENYSKKMRLQQQQIFQLKAVKKQLVEKCIKLQKFIEQNIKTDVKTQQLISSLLYNKDFGQSNCICKPNKNKPEEEGEGAINWLKHIQKVMKQNIQLLKLMSGQLHNSYLEKIH